MVSYNTMTCKAELYYLQCDIKGHAGHTGLPLEKGNRSLEVEGQLIYGKESGVSWVSRLPEHWLVRIIP